MYGWMDGWMGIDGYRWVGIDGYRWDGIDGWVLMDIDVLVLMSIDLDGAPATFAMSLLWILS